MTNAYYNPYPEIDDVEFHGRLAVEFATRPDGGPNGWQKHVTKREREYLVQKQARLAAHLYNIWAAKYGK